ncbi:MAG: hypothetical protein NC344_00135 [Bacteroidales bacterium]|nr:hypothetical protein [Bacteroidales bacterium]MCM1146245.1 hypothetical protein [Bacteroidales bacterium]MCM1205317.1 hypothetical protein [Bacillota bacterium]MCM1509596.1 hypothetical protein [Clostridium sp.]
MNNNTKMVVFDDDPTGIQTVHGCLLITDWSEENITEAMNDKQPFFYLLTNTRALTASEAERVLESAVEAVLRVNEKFGYRLICVSRSDSCLRGHFPLETDIISRTLEKHGIKVWQRIPFCPAFIESGRVTVNGTHYMKVPSPSGKAGEETLVPVSETEFARDNVFGYKNSALTEYIKEKGGNPDGYEIVNAESYAELDAFRDRLFTETKDFDGAVVIRSSSSLPRSMSGISDKPYLSREDLGIKDDTPGVFIVGSHVRKTTVQLENLLTSDSVRGIELPIERILDEPENLMSDTLMEMSRIFRDGKTPVVFTARKEVRINNPEKRQQLGQTVSDFLVGIVRNMPFTPAYLVAKGGITSHDILTKGLEIKVGRVMGQAINSVPCVMAKKFGYIIFPGNVGGETSLLDIHEKFRGRAPERI